MQTGLAETHAATDALRAELDAAEAALERKVRALKRALPRSSEVPLATQGRSLAAAAAATAPKLSILSAWSVNFATVSAPTRPWCHSRQALSRALLMLLRARTHALQVESTIASAAEQLGRLAAERDGFAAEKERIEGLLASLAATLGCDPGGVLAPKN
jgi:hypothetical protein